MSEYYSQYQTGQSNRLISKCQEMLNQLISTNPDQVDIFLMNVVSELSLANVNKNGQGTLDFSNIEGGPFAALIIQHNDKGEPMIVGVGANHVVPESDPSAHGEMSAIRDAIRRLGYSDLTGMKMYSSCECCPQCQSAVTAVGITELVYANTRFEAADIGFSDEQQYRLMAQLNESISSLYESEFVDEYLKYLGDYDAVVLDQNHQIIAHDGDQSVNDPFQSLPSLRAILRACKKLNTFHLPEDVILISRYKPHPIAFVTADWARVGRVRNKTNPEDPSLDHFKKDASRMLYVKAEFEEFVVVDALQEERIVVQSTNIIIDVLKSEEGRFHVKTDRIIDKEVLSHAQKAFKQWWKIVKANQDLKY